MFDFALRSFYVALSSRGIHGLANFPGFLLRHADDAAGIF
jgi:hypothetical protein